MSSMLEQAIIDAAKLKEAAIKNAENILLEKYASELKEAVNSILEQPEEEAPMDPALPGEETAPTEEPIAKDIPMAATDGEKLCPCPDEDEEIEINFDELSQKMSGEEEEGLPGQMGDTLSPDSGLLEEELEEGYLEEAQDGMIIPAEFAAKLRKYQSSPSSTEGDTAVEDPINKLIQSAIEQTPVSAEEIDAAIEALNAQGADSGIIRNLEKMKQMNVDNTVAPDAAMAEQDYTNPVLEGMDEEDLNSLIEMLQVEINPVPHGHIGHATTAERVQAGEIEMARAQDTKVAEEMKKMKKALERLQESHKKLEQENKSLKVENNNIKGIAIKASEKLNEINLENAKLIYENRALKSVSLNERQKETIVEAISKVGSVNEAKVVYETLIKSSNVKGNNPSSLSEALSVGRSNLLGVVKPTSKSESIGSPYKDRMLKLAGIKRNQ
jgi:hypothetical protein